MKVSMKTMIPTTMLALSAMAVSSCGSKVNNDVNNNPKNKVKLASFDSTKANLPIIDGNKVTYRNTDNDVVSIRAGLFEENTLALYKAINKFSTKENPNITEPEKFYAEVEKNIPKNSLNDVLQVQAQALVGMQCSNLLDELVDIYTDGDSEKGKTITVNEYTQMMDAWSSTGVRE